jgi:hypothetical protein
MILFKVQMNSPAQPGLPTAIEQQLKNLPAVAANIREFREFIKIIYDFGTGYGKAVLGLGYIGFFALWSGTKAQTAAHFPRLVLWSALLLGISLFSYMAFEVLQSAAISLSSLAMFERLKDQTLDVALYGFSVDMQKRRGALLRLWPFVFIGTTLTGFAGAALLIVGWIRTLAG